MIINPIMPVWLMSIVCIALLFLVVFNNKLRMILKDKKNNNYTKRQKSLIIKNVLNMIIKSSIIVLLFIINLRMMIPNGKSVQLNNNLNVLFAIDTSVSMQSLDYYGNNERMEGVIKDTTYIVDELQGAKFSIITFGNEPKKNIPFTPDSSIVKAELEALQTENPSYAHGSSLNIVKSIIEETIKSDMEKHEKKYKYVLFIISDGEITKKNEQLESFETIGDLIINGAVMGYGSLNGGKMYQYKASNSFIYDPNGYSFTAPAISKIDENNLNKMAKDLNVEYIKMDNTSNIYNKIKEIKSDMTKLETEKKEVDDYQDIYYYFAIALFILIMIDFAIKRFM